MARRKHDIHTSKPRTYGANVFGGSEAAIALAELVNSDVVYQRFATEYARIYTELCVNLNEIMMSNLSSRMKGRCVAFFRDHSTHMATARPNVPPAILTLFRNCITAKARSVFRELNIPLRNSHDTYVYEETT